MLLPIEIASFICTNSCVLCLICKDGKFKWRPCKFGKHALDKSGFYMHRIKYLIH